jgi:hypothetical protein
MPPCHLAGAHCFFSCGASSYSFLLLFSIKFCYRFAICVAVKFSVQVTQGLKVF